MKEILIDMDDTLLLDGFLNMLNYFNKSTYKYEDIGSYYVEEVLSKEKLIEYQKFFKNNNVYDYAVPAPYSAGVLKKLMLEYELYICSSYDSGLDNKIMPELLPKKCDCLIKNYPFLTSKNFIFCNDKSMINADIKIDDKVENLKGDCLKLLFTAYHNKDIRNIELQEKNIVRVNDWLEIEDKLLKKEKVFTIK